jgi:hypothetical protein
LDAGARPEHISAKPSKNVFTGMSMRWNSVKEFVISLAYSVMRIFSYGAIPPRGCGVIKIPKENVKMAQAFT